MNKDQALFRTPFSGTEEVQAQGSEGEDDMQCLWQERTLGW